MNKSSPATLSSVARRDLFTKLGQGGLTGAICGAIYHGLQRSRVFPVHLRTDCLSWHLLPFHDFWIWPYASMILIVGLAWLTLPNATAVYRFRNYLISVSVIGWLCFIFYPTACSREGIVSQHPLYGWLILADAPTNCFPCLHAALTLLAAVLLTDQASALRGFFWRGIVVIWTAAVLVSILALRQHTGIDVFAGSCLGGVAGASYIKRSYPARSRFQKPGSSARADMTTS